MTASNGGYFGQFGIDQAVVARVLGRALSRGAVKAEVVRRIGAHILGISCG